MLEIEVDGAQQVKRLFPDALSLFVIPPSREEQERRLRGRGDPGDKVLARLKKAEVEEPIGRAGSIRIYRADFTWPEPVREAVGRCAPGGDPSWETRPSSSAR